MGYLPTLAEAQTSRMITDAFYGYDHRLKSSQGTWFEETGLSTRAFPLLATRPRRGIKHMGCDVSNPTTMVCKDQLAWIGEDNRIWYDCIPIEGITLTPGKKQLVSMGAYLCVFPDGVYVNTQNLKDKGYMGNTVEITGDVSIAMCNMDGDRYDPEGTAVVSNTAPEDPKNGDYWIDSSDSPHALKRYSSAQAQWVSFTTVYLKIAAEGIGKGFKEQDTVRISGLHAFKTITSVYQQVESLNTDMIIQKREDDYIIVAGMLDRATTINNATVRLERRVPDLDFVCELDNRLWGCKYGYADGEIVNTIYATAQGDCTNWYRYAGISTDSYAVQVGSDGPFTGMIAYGGYVLAFKERCVHKIYGTMPSNFTVSTTQCRGVARGSGRSLAIVNERLYYLSNDGVVMYDGSLPVSVFDAFDGKDFRNGRAGVLRNEYYICMQDRKGNDQVWTYDTDKGIWHHAYDENITEFIPSGSDLLSIGPGNVVRSESGDEGDPEDPVHFDAISGLIGFEIANGNQVSAIPEHKYISRFVFRVKMHKGDELEVLVRYDSEGMWESQGVIHMDSTNSFALPVIPRRCDHMQIRLRGRGDIRVFSIAKIIEVGSDM